MKQKNFKNAAHDLYANGNVVTNNATTYGSARRNASDTFLSLGDLLELAY